MANGRCRMHGGPSPGAPKAIGTPISLVATRQKRSPGDVKYRR
ncbi:hypothetical protein [Bradyrhizobium sp. 1(2017)]